MFLRRKIENEVRLTVIQDKIRGVVCIYHTGIKVF